MRLNHSKCVLKAALSAATVLLLAAGTARGQVVVNLTAAPTSTVLPDGSSVPMWGYSCGSADTNCKALNPSAATGGLWSPVIITVPTGSDLKINLTNSLSFTTTSNKSNSIPTSIVIAGQIGGGLGDVTSTCVSGSQSSTGATCTPSPTHANQGATWPIANTGAVFTPPSQAPRVQSFSTEVPYGQTTGLTWKAPAPGTYLLESGTHPSIQATMGLIGMVVVTSAPAGSTPGSAYPNVSYNADVPILMSEIDPVQNNKVATAVTTDGFVESATLGVKTGGPVVSIAVTSGGSGYTTASVSFDSNGVPAATAHAIIDTTPGSPTLGQVTQIVIDNPGSYVSTPNVTITGDGSGATAVAALQLTNNAIALCSGGATACYPPVVNYSPRYFLINGVAFDKTNTANSVFPVSVPPSSQVTGALLVRMVNAGSRMHIPSIVNAATGGLGGFSLVAEDGNPLPGNPRVQSEVFMAAGKTYDVMIDAPTGGVTAVTVTGGTGYTSPVASFSGGGGTGAAATVNTDGSGNITSITVTNPGVGYSSAPTVTIADSGGTGSGASATAVITPGAGIFPVFDRQLSLSANAINRDAGMLAYISVNGGGLPSNLTGAGATANPDTYNAVVAGQTLNISDSSKGVLANDINIFGVRLMADSATHHGTMSLNPDGTFTYVADNSWTPGDSTVTPAVPPTTDSFTYCGNGAGSGAACSTITFGLSTVTANDTIQLCPGTGGCTFNSNLAKYLKVSAPGLLAGATDSAGLPLKVDVNTIGGVNICGSTPSAPCLIPDAAGGFTYISDAAGPKTFTFQAVNSLGVHSGTATATVNFYPGSGLTVSVLDGADKKTLIGDYRWVIEEDRTFFVDPNCTGNPPPSGCPGSGSGVVPNFGTNFHTSYMPVIATGCTGDVSCENNQTVLGAPVPKTPYTLPGDVPLCGGAVPVGTACLDPKKRYYISVLPGDAAQPFIAGYAGAPDCSASGMANGMCGHGMGGAPIPKGDHSQQSVMVLTEPSPYPPATLTVFVFEDDYPLNGEHDAGGGIDVLSPQEPGLGGFQITLQDDAGGTGDATGTPTYDMFNMPLSNSLAGTIDPVTKLDACPISPQATQTSKAGDSSQNGIVGMIITCPTYESDGKTLSPMAGQAVVKNLYAGRYGVVANPGADRIGRGEEWLQTNTLDGQKAHDSFMRIGEPGYFQEFGPAGYHVTIGFANPKIINGRGTAMCDKTQNPNADCAHEVKGHVSMARMSRTPDERLYGSGTHDAYAFTQCYVSIGDPDGAEFGFTKCDDSGNFDFPSVPAGNWKITTFDQWNDQVVDGITTAVGMCDPQSSLSPNPPTNCKALVDMGEVAVHQWQSNIYTRTFLDMKQTGVSHVDSNGNAVEPGLPLVATNIRFRDGSFSNFNNTDLNGYAGFNEVFPLFNWYVIETDSTRYKNTGTHVVYDSGGPVDGSSPNGVPCSSTTTGTKPCGSSSIANNLANTYEPNPLPSDLSVPGAVYCNDADCTGLSISTGPVPSDTTKTTTGRIDPPWVTSYGWQGFSGQNNFLEFGKKPYAEGENGGIHGHVVYASTRPFDDPQLLLQLSWEPLVPHVRINLYKEDLASDGVTPTLTLVDHTETSSFDDWAQGFRTDGKPNMNCPGQGTDSSTYADPYFWFTLKDQPQWLDLYNNGGSPSHALPYDSQFKCYDGMHNWNQLQPAPYDGMYSFPSVTSMDPVSGKPTGTNCTRCTTNPDKSDTYRYGAPMLPDGKYVVEVVVPPGFELVKEEDKNILIGDNFIAPVTQQFGGLGSIFILPDQAEVAEAYNANNAQNPTNGLGRDPSLPSHEGDTGSIETYWPCVGEVRTVPDYISLFPGSAEVAPFAGAQRPLCDRKEVALTDQTAALAKFYIFTNTHTASHFTGVITDDFTAEFDPYSPQFGEKFAPAYLPISFKDWAGNEITRVYSDAWGAYNGLNYSTWEVNPPNPTGYGPTMMVGCMNDPNLPDPLHPGQYTTDPLYQAGYSDFCYELPFMPGQTGYFDTPVVPTSAFAGGYNTPDCAYPDATPAVKSVTGDVAGPWVSAPGKRLTITALGDQLVDNNAYSGPQSTAAPYNKQKITRHYGFGSAPTDFSAFPKLSSPNTYSCNSNSATALCPYVTVGGKALAAVSWSDGSIAGNAPNGVAACPVQQQAVYSGSAAACGELVITAANGKQSVDTVTVTIGGKTPTVMTAGQTIQNAIDTAKPGDLIIVPPGTYTEMVLMWKPVRLQGVGAASSIIDASPHPAGRLDPWRRKVLCLFGLALNGTPIAPSASTPGGSPYDPSNTYTCDASQQFAVDRLPLEATVGWDATLNGNLAEQLIEPTLMGAFEGAGITVLSKGVKFPAGSDPFASDVFPTGTQLLTASDCLNSTRTANPYPGNFLCNPSSIDGLTVKNSSQGGGGILVHGWGHDLQIANNRVLNNQGTLSGGITVGQGEHPDAYLAGGVATTVPGSCVGAGPFGTPANMALPFCFDMDVNVHNNQVVQNSSLGDELFSSTPAGAGGVTFCNGSDYYKFNYNWVCGNMSTGDGAGVAHVGLSYDGDIEHNTILFNESTNPTIVTNGGGLLVMGAPDVDPPCGITTDQDCVSAPNTVTPSDGVGPGLIINANLIQGNSADAGSGGGLRLQHINGNEVINFPNGKQRTVLGIPLPVGWPTIPGHPAQPAFQLKTPWYAVQVTNNIIVNNVAGWDGGGLSLQDALAVDIVNNTVVSNNSTASSGVLFQTLFAPLASTQGSNCTVNSGTESCPQPAGLVSVTNSAVLVANLPSNVVCPTGHGATGTNADCTKFSVPGIYNDVFWQNRSYMIGVGGLGKGLVNQQNMVTMFNPGFTGTGLNPTPVSSQTSTGSCDTANASYWDIGVRGDSGPGNHSSGGVLSPQYSVLTNTSGLAENGGGANNLLNPAAVVKTSYCNGSRLPVEAGLANVAFAWQVPPGTNESNALPAPPFTLMAGATVDEGNNWVNLRWGPLSMVSPVDGKTMLGNFALTGTSQAIDAIPTSASTYANAPSTDFNGKPRPDVSGTAIDIGAIEFQAATPILTITGGPLNFGNVVVTTTSAAQTLTLTNNGVGTASITSIAVTSPFSRSTGGCGTTLASGASCSINIVFAPTATGPATGTVTVASSNATVLTPPVGLSGTGVPAIRTVTVSPSTLAFGSWATGTTSNPLSLTVTNTGNVALAGGASTFGGGTPQPYSRVTSGSFPANAPNCGATLAIGAACTIKVQFAPTTSGLLTRSLGIAFTSTTVTPASVSLTGAGVATRGTVTISPNPLSITLPRGRLSGSAAVTLTNSSSSPSSVAVTGVAVSGSGLVWSWTKGTDNCTGANLAPGQSCTVQATFSRVLSAGTHTGSITFTDTATASPQSGVLTGIAQ